MYEKRRGIGYQCLKHYLDQPAYAGNPGSVIMGDGKQKPKGGKYGKHPICHLSHYLAEGIIRVSGRAFLSVSKHSGRHYDNIHLYYCTCVLYLHCKGVL
jgi:hypothetical protein